MGWYAKIVLPRLMNWAMDREVLGSYRRSQLAQVEGKVLEIGFGTGVNIPFCPLTVHTITTVDRNPGMNTLAQKRLIKEEPFRFQACRCFICKKPPGSVPSCARVLPVNP